MSTSATAAPPEHFFLGDIRLDRRHALGMLSARFSPPRARPPLNEAAGLKLYSAFEQEFVYTGVDDRPGSPYSLDACRRQGIFGEVFVAALREAGVEPDSFLPEYGARQYEVTCAPAIGLKSGRRRGEAPRDGPRRRPPARASRHLRRRSSTPTAPATASTSISASAIADGRPATHDPAGAYGLTPSRPAFHGRRADPPAGDRRRHRARARSPTFGSAPNRWAPTCAYIADRDREASLRVCPVLTLPGLGAERQFNVEYRVADAAASPYLALGALVFAGVDGIRRKLPLPEPRNVAAMSAAERTAAGIRHLPQSLGEALDALAATPAAREWFGPTYLDAYLRHKRAEIAMLAGLDEAEQCRRYAETY